jgi:hypothetical protein
MRSGGFRCVGILLVLVATAGCGLNALRLDYARNVGSQGKAAAEASGSFLQRVDLARRDANIELVAADPACGGRSPALVRYVPRLAAREPRGWLCVPPGWKEEGSSPFPLRPLTPELKPTFDLVGSLADYADALTKVVDAKGSDPTKPLLDALETARTAQDALNAIGGGSGGAVPAAGDPRVKAVTAFVQMLAELSEEADKVRRVRAVLVKYPDGAAPLVAALRNDLRRWNLSLQGDLTSRQIVAGALQRRSIDRDPPDTIAERRETMARYYALDDTRRATSAIYPNLVKALDDLGEADADLRRVIVDHPQLNKKERARIAEINRQRVVRALQNLTALINSFRGA